MIGLCRMSWTFRVLPPRRHELSHLPRARVCPGICALLLNYKGLDLMHSSRCPRDVHVCARVQAASKSSFCPASVCSAGRNSCSQIRLLSVCLHHYMRRSLKADLSSASNRIFESLADCVSVWGGVSLLLLPCQLPACCSMQLPAHKEEK